MRARFLISLILLATPFVSLSNSAKASVTKTIYSFCKKASCPDGAYPNGLISDAAGNLYGTTDGGGGEHNGGVVFELIRPTNTGGKWKELVLYTFCPADQCTDGAEPASPLVIDNQGSLYGTTSAGGEFGNGTVFKLSATAQKRASWHIEVLSSFCSNSSPCGNFPQYGLAYLGQSSGAPYDGISPLFGTSLGVSGPVVNCPGGCGTVFELTHQKKKWKFESIHDFCVEQSYCPDGGVPAGPLLVDASGNLIGTTAQGGPIGSGGAIFKMTYAKGTWQEDILYGFCETDCLDGAIPYSGVIQDSSGNLFGTTQFGGAKNGGTLFKLIPGDPSQLVVLHSFCSYDDCADGRGPWSNGLAIDASGNLFGTTANGGGNDEVQYGAGVVFESGQRFTRLHAFCKAPNCADGEAPRGPIVLSSSNKIFGAALGNGSTNKGLIFEVTP